METQLAQASAHTVDTQPHPLRSGAESMGDLLVGLAREAGREELTLQRIERSHDAAEQVTGMNGIVHTSYYQSGAEYVLVGKVERITASLKVAPVAQQRSAQRNQPLAGRILLDGPLDQRIDHALPGAGLAALAERPRDISLGLRDDAPAGCAAGK